MFWIVNVLDHWTVPNQKYSTNNCCYHHHHHHHLCTADWSPLRKATQLVWGKRNWQQGLTVQPEIRALINKCLLDGSMTGEGVFLPPPHIIEVQKEKYLRSPCSVACSEVCLSFGKRAPPLPKNLHFIAKFHLIFVVFQSTGSRVFLAPSMGQISRESDADFWTGVMLLSWCSAKEVIQQFLRDGRSRGNTVPTREFLFFGNFNGDYVLWGARRDTRFLICHWTKTKSELL